MLIGCVIKYLPVYLGLNIHSQKQLETKIGLWQRLHWPFQCCIWSTSKPARVEPPITEHTLPIEHQLISSLFLVHIEWSLWLLVCQVKVYNISLNSRRSMKKSSNHKMFGRKMLDFRTCRPLIFFNLLFVLRHLKRLWVHQQETTKLCQKFSG